MSVLLSVTALACAIVHIVADHRGAWTTTYWSKPATMLAILALVLLSPAPLAGYPALIALGLVCSLAGDVFLMLRPVRFLAGLVAFLVAHLVYIVAFSTLATPAGLVDALLLLGLGVVIYGILWPGLGRLRLPVLGYVLAIVTMVWAAWSAWRGLGTQSSAVGAAGALLFLISDTSLGIARFRYRFPGAQLVTLGTYYLGQWLIALSAGWLLMA